MGENKKNNDSPDGIEELIKIFKTRIRNIADRSLTRFWELYREHPGF